jgi:hypothetical protein
VRAPRLPALAGPTCWHAPNCCAARHASQAWWSSPAPALKPCGKTPHAYANFLAGKATPQEAALLPEAQRGTVAAGANGDAALKEIKDPLSQLVAAGVLFQTGRATPTTIALATDTASAQGWRRPLLAWLLVQAQRADQAGAGDEAARIRRRIAVVEQGGVKP